MTNIAAILLTKLANSSPHPQNIIYRLIEYMNKSPFPPVGYMYI